MKDDEERESPLQKVSYTFGEVNEEEDEDGIPAAKSIFSVQPIKRETKRRYEESPKSSSSDESNTSTPDSDECSPRENPY
jgi:hypothetical protein